MNLNKFLNTTGRQLPLICIQGNIFETPADHIAFAVHYPNSSGYSNNGNGGFAGKVCELGWPELETIRFEKGVPISKNINGKMFHALPVHTPEEGGWDESPELIEQCLNKLTVSSEEVIAIVLIGGGNAGIKYKASVRNIEGMSKSYKTVVLYVKETDFFEAILRYGIVSATIPLAALPKAQKFRQIAEKIEN